MTSLKKKIHVAVALFAAAVICLSVCLSLRLAYSGELRLLQARLTLAMETVAQHNAEDSVVLGSLASEENARVTVLKKDGGVLFDSGSGSVDFFARPEVRDALQKGEGYLEEGNAFSGRIRLSGCRLLDGAYLVRLEMQGDAYRDFPLAALAGFCLLVAVLGVVFGLIITKTVIGPIEYASQNAPRIMEDDWSMDERVLAHQETAKLLETLQTMNAKLKGAVEELRQKSVELESIIGSMINGLIAVDGQLRVVRMNQAAKKMLGVTGAQEGRGLLEASGNARLEAAMLDAMEKDELSQVELSVRTNPGHRLIRVYISGLEHEGELLGAVALLEDITELRNLEQMRTDFAANVTHELKTPLTSIKGFVETLLNGAVEDPDTARYFLNIISVESDRLYRLIDDILSLSSMEAGRLRVSTMRLSLGQYAQEACEFLQNAAQQKEIGLTINVDEKCFIQANEDHLKQLLINLIENAVKYTPEGGQVTVTVERIWDSVFLRVKDTGIGISKEHIPRLFERFYRVDKGRSRSMGGTGLGLAIAKHIVQEMNGSIKVESEPMVGTEFIVELPYAQEAAN